MRLNMTHQIFATKVSMGQTWTKSGRRLPVSKLQVNDNVVIGKKTVENDKYSALQIGFGTKKLKNMSKPLRTIVEKSGFSFGVRKIREIRLPQDSDVTVGTTIKADSVLKVGDIVTIQGVTKGRGFAGVMKRHGFAGGPATHGQSDRARAPGSIGQRTTPGRVYKGKKMAGHYGNVNLSVKNLQVIHIDPQTGEVWVNGPVPGHFNSLVRLTVTGNKPFEGFDTSAAPKMSEVAEDSVTVEASEEAATEETHTEVENTNTEEKVETDTKE